MTDLVDPKQCESCVWHGQITAAGTVYCDLMGQTGICRVANRPYTDATGSCRWYKCQEGKQPHKQMPPIASGVVKAAQATAPKSKGGRKKGPTPKMGVAMIDAAGKVIARFSGIFSASRITGDHTQSIYQACNWRRMADRGRRYVGHTGKKGYTYRYVNDPDIKDAMEDYHGPVDQKPEI